VCVFGLKGDELRWAEKWRDSRERAGGRF